MNDQPESKRRYRVVQWATGTVGTSALRALIEHPEMELVGVHVHSAAKEGRDAGDLCGLAPVGVTATRDIAAIVNLRPDCVVYMQEGCNFDDVCQLLHAGINIVTTRGEFLNPARMNSSVRERVEAACRQGRASIHSTGSSPGFITEAIPIVLTSIQRRLDWLCIDEFADIVPSCSPEMIFEVMGFGETPAEFAKRKIAERDECFDHSLNLLADALSLPLDGVEVSSEIATARSAVRVGNGVIQPGTVAAQRITTSGMRNGRALLRLRANWYCTKDIDAAWEVRGNGWRVQVEGDAPLDVHIHFPAAKGGDVRSVMAGYTAHRPVNAIPYVCAAAPGIVTTVDLPQIIANLGRTSHVA
jgi:hypothetical protein